MPKYVSLDGEITNNQDVTRGVWYSANACCGYWTDDWEKLRKVGPGIPCCPVCRSPGMQTTWHDWTNGAEKYEHDGHPGYLMFCLEIIEKCGAAINAKWIDRYEAWKRSKGI